MRAESTVAPETAASNAVLPQIAPAPNLETMGGLWAVEKVSGYRTDTPSGGIYSCCDARAPFEVDNSLGINPSQNYWRALEVIQAAKEALGHSPDKLTIVASEGIDIRYAESPEVRAWVQKAFEAAQGGKQAAPLVLANDSGSDRSWSYYITADVYPDKYGVILRQAHPTLELGEVVSTERAADGMVYDERGIFPRFTTAEEKDVWVARTRVSPGKQQLTAEGVEALNRLLDMWVPPAEELAAVTLLAKALKTFSLTAESAELLGGTALSGAKSAADHSARPASNASSADFAAFFYSVAVDAWTAVEKPGEHRQQLGQISELGDTIAGTLATAGYSTQSEAVRLQQKRLASLLG